MAARTNEDVQREILEIELETKRITLERTKQDNQVYRETEEDRARKRAQAQTNAKMEMEKQRRREQNCRHQQGVGPGDVCGEGSGKSCLTLSRIFFPWNCLVQCVWCGLKNQTPSPGRKNRKPQRIRVNGEWRMETADEVKVRIEAYEADLKYHEELVRAAKGNGLPPMMGPTYEFTDQDGMPVVPQIR